MYVEDDPLPQRPNAQARKRHTQAAKRKLRRLGIKLSTVKSGGRREVALEY